MPPQVEAASEAENSTSKTVLNDFLSAFGEPAEVQKEVEEYWRDGGSPFPIEIYNYLINARKTGETPTPAGKISEKSAQFLKAYFKESFLVDPVTAYYRKHRDPLIKATTDAYVAFQKRSGLSKPLYRVQADIINLGGLNGAVGERLANDVIRLMAGILRDELGKHAEVCAIRHGGDEIDLYLKPNKDIGIEEIDNNLLEAKKKIASFIKDTGLRNLPHLKRGKKPGVGVGCGLIELRAQSDVARIMELETKILESKGVFQDLLGNVTNPSPAIRVDAIKAAFNEENFKKYCIVPPTEKQMLKDVVDVSGDTPKLERLERMRAYLSNQKSDLPLNSVEKQLLEGTHRVTAKRDPVNGLPLVMGVQDMQDELLPHFLKKHQAREVRLVHFDFNNLGGGNTLGRWVADRMSVIFKKSIEVAMKDMKFAQFYPYLSSAGGGKYDLLLPYDVSSQAIVELRNGIQKELDRRSSESLNLTPEEMAATYLIASEVDRERKQQVAKDKEYSLSSRHNRREAMPLFEFKSGDPLTLNKIWNNKTHRKGVYFEVESAQIDNPGTKRLDDAMRGLKGQSDKGQKAMDRLVVARRKKEQGMLDKEVLRGVNGEAVRTHRSKHEKSIAAALLEKEKKPATHAGDVVNKRISIDKSSKTGKTIGFIRE